MAKTSILILLLPIFLVVADHQAAAVATKQLSPAAQKSIDDLSVALQMLIDGVVSAAPPEKQKETLLAVLKHLKPLTRALDKAKETGDEKKIANLAIVVEIAAAMVKDAPSEKKLQTMEESLSSVATPSLRDCPDVDKAFCEMHSKVRQALDGVTAAAPPADKTTQAKASAIKETMRALASTVNKAYANGDEKKIAQVLAAYTKAAELVTAAAPADKLKVMEITFAEAARD